MGAEQVSNFATTTLAGGTSLSATGTTFTVASGGGTLFPLTHFYVTIDTEVILIDSRANDVFTINNNGRGQDGTQAGTHASGAPVIHAVIAYNIWHLWANTSDTYVPEVPPQQHNVSPSPYDNEFETLGPSWQLYPNAGLSAGAIFDVNVSNPIFSHLLLQRGYSDNALYTAYVPFAPPNGSAFTLTCKVSDSINIANNYTQAAEIHFFVTDTANPTSGADTNNRFRVDLITNGSITNNAFNQNNRQVRCLQDVNGNGTQVGPSLYLSMAQPVWLRITYNGNGTWNGYIGDGFTYSLLYSLGGLSFSPQSLGLNFYAGNLGASVVTHTALVDYVRVVVGQVLPPYGG